MIDKTKSPTVYSSLETAMAAYKETLSPRYVTNDEILAFRAGYSACLSDFVRLANEQSTAQRGGIVPGEHNDLVTTKIGK